MENDYAEDVLGVRVVRWNPLRDGDRRVDNFGDLLGPLVSRRLAPGRTEPELRFPSLLTIGSIMQFAEPGDVVWGSGVNAKLRPRRLDAGRVFDVRAVRGPLTAVALEVEGSTVPRRYGDPGILLPQLFPETRAFASPGRKRHAVVVVPNVNDTGLDAAGHHVVAPTGSPWAVIEEILSADLVVGTSLHAIITAEAYGVPARAVRSVTESPVKYVDYYEGTGRTGVFIADSVEEAVEAGGAGMVDEEVRARLLGSFPADLWGDYGMPTPESVRPLAEVVADVTDRALAAAPGAEAAAWTEMARRIAVPVLRDRATVLDDDDLDRVVEAVRRLDAAGVLDGADARWGRTRDLAKYRLTSQLRRSALLNSRGVDAVLDQAERAGEDGLLRVGGTLQLPDGALDEFAVTLVIADDSLVQRRTVGDTDWYEVEPTLGTVRWQGRVPIEEMPDGDWVLVVIVDGPGGVREAIVRSVPSKTFPRWWHEGRPYRVDRTGRGNVVIHKEVGAS